ncbi:DUF2634 domain-containing protein [Clostridium botulinum]|uniref:DUF2634 domain-containing protein n=1 Tax=Clostridium botulinum (strain Langeland / NCTC 10281 / Type F) TaxID=441772 RepID=A7GFT1_CLOBL|nr:DUF2634 domain-containing protein [Clostridium botulinum]ABS39735.1 conserved hypothetical protein [Clostridium botulinum F str. Langeland]ADG00051.1 conserved hypothetical protein [Clostridium botulinum F str. 230613]KKM42396.1 phage protein [Clostridium botulinum]MBY6793121.1 DUF2634 domain-containing protein [Clostridium botulinum]MBY6937331.1 DUF2634 domain-containing protein [Clostridium botulinum]
MSEVSILPRGAILDEDIEVEQIIEPTKTYKIKDNRIVGFIDNVEALKQAIALILNTERYEYLIYSWNYGSELNGLIGRQKDIAESEFKRRIREALSQDDRINNVDNFIFNYDKDGVEVSFTVFSIYGEFAESVVK